MSKRLCFIISFLVLVLVFCFGLTTSCRAKETVQEEEIVEEPPEEEIMMTIIQNISQIFYYIAGGFGLLFAGIGGFKVFLNWVSDVKEKKRIEKMTLELKEKYPIEEHGKTFQLIASRSNPRPKYLLNKNTNIKHWIASRPTFDALEFEFDMVKKLNQKDFDLIETGKKILIE